MLGACGIFDLFWWSILGEMLELDNNPSKLLGIGLSANVLGVLLGGLIGVILAIYLATRKDPVAKKHGYIQLTILVLYGILILTLYLTGNLDLTAIDNATQMLSNNLTSIKP